MKFNGEIKNKNFFIGKIKTSWVVIAIFLGLPKRKK